MNPLEPPRWSRRSVLVGMGAFTLAACAKSDGSSPDRAGAVKQGDVGSVLLPFFPSSGVILAGRPQRLPLGVADGRGVPLKDVPERLTMSVTDQEGHSAGAPQEVPSRSEGLPRAYFPLTVTLPGPGIYTVRTEIAGEAADASFEAGTTSPLPQVGDPLPRAATPTVTDHRGVDPICTQDPPCPLHDSSLSDALGSGRPTVLLVSTPAFCQVAICGPVLDVLLSERDDGATFIHAEVYASGAEAAENIASARPAPIMGALGMTFEPALFVTDGAGVIRNRFDAIFDRSELAEGLAAARA